MVVLLFDGFSTTLAGVGVVLITALLGQPCTFTPLVEVGGGVDPVEVVPVPEFAPQAVSTKTSAVASDITNHIDRRPSI